MAYRWKFKGHRNEYINRMKKYERNLQKWRKSHTIINGLVICNLGEDPPDRPSSVTVSKEHFTIHKLFNGKINGENYEIPFRMAENKKQIIEIVHSMAIHRADSKYIVDFIELAMDRIGESYCYDVLD